MSKKDEKKLEQYARNFQAVQALFQLKVQGNEPKVVVNSTDLKQAGYEGLMPTQVFADYENYKIRNLGQDAYQIIQVRPEMQNKKEPVGREFADKPLPIDLEKNRIDLRKLAGKTKSVEETEQAVKKQIKGDK